MTPNDWTIFINRIPVGTRIQYDTETGLGPLHVEGILIERETPWDYAAHKIHYPSGNISSESYDYPPELMKYLINDQWLTFEQVMS